MPHRQKRDLIGTTRQLWRVVKACKRCRVIGIDTESNSFWAFRERICLIQILADRKAYLLDPLQLEDLSPLGEVFHDPGILKIFHGADYDLRCLSRDFDMHPAPIFDTMIAASLLNYPALGLGALVKKQFDVDLPKTNALTRFDWAVRPLPEQHIDYVINDVLYLPRLREILLSELEQKDLIEEVEWEFRQLEQIARRPQANGTEDFLSTKGARQLDPLPLTVFKRLFDYREQYAKEADVPRFKVLSNKTLFDIAAEQPRKEFELKKIRGISAMVMRRHGKKLLEAVHAALKDFEEGMTPIIPQHKPMRGPHLNNDLETALKQWRKEEAERRGIAPLAVLPTSCLRDIARASHFDRMMLSQIPGMLPRRMERYAETLLDLCRQVKKGKEE